MAVKIDVIFVAKNYTNMFEYSHNGDNYLTAFMHGVWEFMKHGCSWLNLKYVHVEKIEEST